MKMLLESNDFASFYTRTKLNEFYKSKRDENLGHVEVKYLLKRQVENLAEFQNVMLIYDACSISIEFHEGLHMCAS